MADEVQSGFGRTGDHFWGFEAHDVVPDIVTLGKPIGNGFSMAAVVTTPAIVASLTNESDFFSTSICLAFVFIIFPNSVSFNA